MEEKDLKKSNNSNNGNIKKKGNPLKQQKNYQQKPQNKNIFLSVVVPLYNEEDSLPELILQIESELKSIPQARNSYEVIFVDDGSKDKSFDVIRSIRSRNQNVRAIRFRRNYGKSAALAVGFDKARGQYVATLDADLQDDPAEFAKMLEKINEGYDLVSGWKKKRHDPITKTIPSRFFNFVTSCVSGLKLHDFNCGIKLYRRDVVKYLQVYGEMHRYLPVLAKWGGFKVTEIPVQHHPRRYGKSKFGFSRFIKGFLDLLTVWFTNRYLKRPLHFFGTLGTLIGLSGLGINIYLTIEWFLGNTYLTNRPLALFGVALIIVGVQLISMGLLGEMIAKNTLEQQNYNIKERI